MYIDPNTISRAINEYLSDFPKLIKLLVMLIMGVVCISLWFKYEYFSRSGINSNANYENHTELSLKYGELEIYFSNIISETNDKSNKSNQRGK